MTFAGPVDWREIGLAELHESYEVFVTVATSCAPVTKLKTAQNGKK